MDGHLTTGKGYLGAYWNARAQDPSDGSARIVRMLEGLKEADPAFANWYRKGWSKKDALRSPIALTADAVQAELTRNRSEEPPYEPIESLGYYFDVWNGGAGGVELPLRCAFGATARPMSNLVLLSVPDRFLDDPTAATDLLRLIVRIWLPDWATVTHQQFRKATGIPVGRPQPGRATYLSRSRRRLRPPRAVTVVSESPGRIYVMRGELDSKTSRAIESRWVDAPDRALR